MTQQCIILQNLSYKTVDDKSVFSDIDLVLTDIKSGLIGKNGIGKSTLVKLITGELQPHSGSVKTFGSIAYCPQDLKVDTELTIGQFFGVAGKIQALENILCGNGTQNDLIALDDDWQVKDRIIQCCKKFAYVVKDFNEQLHHLSNGEIARLYLAKIFYTKPQVDFLLLDEPTNNLDRTARQLLYKAIQEWDRGLLLISHDQSLLEFMDQTILLTERGISVYGGNYNFYQEQRLLEQAANIQRVAEVKLNLSKTMHMVQVSHEKHEKRQAQGRRERKRGDQPKAMHDFFTNRSGRTARMLSKKAERLMNDAKQKLASAREELDVEYIIKVDLPKTFVPNNKTVVVIEELFFRYPQQQSWLLRDFNLIIRGPEHIALCGDNGSGKSTLLKLLCGELQPNAGRVRVGVPVHYLDQSLTLLQPQLSILDNYCLLNPGITINVAHKHLASFLFRGQAVKRRVDSLSSGEKIRAALACVLLGVRPPELLLLDEPTNHLDLENIECLVSILKNYQGALIIVSHDQKFLEQIGISKAQYIKVSGFES